MAFITAFIAGGLGIVAGSIGYAMVSSLVGISLSLGLSYLSSKYLGRKKSRSYSAVSGEIQVGGAVSVQGAFGIVAVAGYRAYYAAFGSGNKYNSEVFVFSTGRCDGLEPYVWINGEKKSLITKPKIGDEANHYDITGFEGLFSIRFYDGRPGQTSDAKLVSDTAGLGNNWKAGSTGGNLCYAVVERLYDKKFNGRRPEILWVLRGLHCYDPRKDSTFSGGSGSHRLSDLTTWEFTQNPAIQRLNYQLGFKGVRSGVALIGMCKQLSQLDTNSYIAAANICDQVRRVGGKNIKTYHCNLLALSGDDHSQILKEFDDAMAGYSLNRAGLAGVLAGAPQIATRTITDEDLRTDGPITLQNRRSAFEQVNHLSGQFTSPESMFQPESLEPITSASDVSIDGRLRTQTNDFLQVTDARIAQYLLTIRYRQNRLGARVTLPVSARLWFVTETGEWVNYDGKTWLVTEKKSGNLTLAETSAEIYAEGGISIGPVITPPSTPINPSLLTTVQNFRARAGILGKEGSYTRPALQFAWDAPGDPTISDVLIEYRQAVGIKEVFTVTCPQPEKGEYSTTNNILSNSIYDCRATIITQPDRLRTWTPWIAITVPTADIAVLLRQFQEDTVEILENNRKELDRLRDIIAIDGAQAATLDEGNSYLHRRTLQKSVDGALARIIREEQVRVTENETMASLVNNVESNLGETFAQGLFKVKTVVPPQDGSLVTLSLTARASIDAGDTYLDSGLYIDIRQDGDGNLSSQVRLRGDQVGITDSRGATQALFSDDGVLFPARIPTLTASKYGARSVPGSALEYKAVQAVNIANGAITADHLNANTANIVSLNVKELLIDGGYVPVTQVSTGNNILVSVSRYNYILVWFYNSVDNLTYKYRGHGRHGINFYGAHIQYKTSYFGDLRRMNSSSAIRGFNLNSSGGRIYGGIDQEADLVSGCLDVSGLGSNIYLNISRHAEQTISASNCHWLIQKWRVND